MTYYVVKWSYTTVCPNVVDLVCCPCTIAHKSDNFIVGVTAVSPTATAPTLWNYDLCGQYPGAVPGGATVSLKCACNIPRRRYVVLQFPVYDHANFCEFEVFTRSEYSIPYVAR